MKKMRKYSGATGLKTLPIVPSTFVARSSPHFMAALSGKTQDHAPRKISTYKKSPASPYVSKKKSSAMFIPSHLPMIHVTAMEEVAEDRDGKSTSPQRKVSSNGSPCARGVKTTDTNEKHSVVSKSSTGRQRKISNTKPKASVLGETPLGRDLIFHRKISNTAAPTVMKVDEAEEKQRLLTKYALNNVTLYNDNRKRRIKNTYFSRYNVNGNLEANVPARRRTQSLNCVAKGDQGRVNTADKFFTPRVIQDESANSIFGRVRAQSLNIVPCGSEPVRTRPSHNRNEGLREIVELKGQRSPIEDAAVTADSGLQVELVTDANQRPASQYPQRKDSNEYNRLSVKRDYLHTAAAPLRKDSQDRNTFLTFPDLRAKSWIEG
ncbi:unnamed protein product [Pocillopora meandrina]|uniref:Uncharacterized protein n=1 Tax=Pocillopora meandrina TaxID=46732 RepID=A0AAU9W7M7_9CNID|nr:unnamed protein product [Pocillopora meandrina]